MGILLLILKIIGILLAVLVLLVAAAVSVPVRYRASVKVQDEAEGKAVFYWLLHAVDVRLCYGQNGFAWKCRILGIPVWGQGSGGQEGRQGSGSQKGRQGSGGQEGRQGSGGQEGRRDSGGQMAGREGSGGQRGRKESTLAEGSGEREEEGSKEQAKKRVAESIKRQKAEIVAFEEGQKKKQAGGIDSEMAGESKKPAESLKQGREENPGQAQGESNSVNLESITGSGLEESFLENAETVIGEGAEPEVESKEEQKDSGRFGRLKSFFAEGRRKVSAIKARIHDIKMLISDETNQKAFFHILQELKCLLWHFSPRRASGEIVFGMGDPALTGEVLGLISFLPFWVRHQITVTPDFMAGSMYLRGGLSGRGHIRIWHLLPSGIRLIKDKNIHRLVAAIRK